MKSNFSVGSIAVGNLGKKYPVVAVEDNHVILTFPDRSRKRVPKAVVVSWELPQASHLEVNDTVQLQGTDRLYRIVLLYQNPANTKASGSLRGFSNEDWAELRTQEGKTAYWNVGQLKTSPELRYEDAIALPYHSKHS